MATAKSTTTTPEPVEAPVEQPGMKTYVVIADAINLTTEIKDGKPSVTRLHRGETVTGPPEHQQIVEFLSMGGIIEEGDTAAARAIQATGNARVITIMGKDERGYRITGAGVAKRMGADDDPVAEPQESAIPIVPTEF